MFDFGLGEIMVLAFIALIVVGPDQIPNVARLLGTWVRQARTVWARLSQDFEDVLEPEPEHLEHTDPDEEPDTFPSPDPQDPSAPP